MAPKTIRLVSWNVNGLRAVLKKDFIETVAKLDADVLGIQETKMQAEQLTEEMSSIDGYRSYFLPCHIQKGLQRGRGLQPTGAP